MTRSSLSLLLALALGVAPGQADAKSTVRVHLQVPVKLTDPAKTNLMQIEDYGATPLWSSEFEIPYDDLEKAVQKKIDEEMAKLTMSGVETCDDPCPDVTWSVSGTPKFSFTQKNDPVFKKIGASSQNKIEASVKFRAKVEFSGTAKAEADVPVQKGIIIVPEHKVVEAPIGLHLEVEIKAKVTATLWPKITLGAVDIQGKIVNFSPNIQLNGVGMELGAELGALVGSSPLGLISGGPLVFVSLFALIGEEAADAAEAKIEGIVTNIVNKRFNGALAQVETAVNKALKPAAVMANAIKDKALDTKLPNVAKSVNQLMGEWEADMKLHTVTPSGGIALSGVVRLDPKPGTAKFTGHLEIPRYKCVYTQFMGVQIPLAVTEAHPELEAHVGKSCSALLGADDEFVSRVYLGANPKTALGPTASALTSWKKMGKPKLTGTLTKIGTGDTAANANKAVYSCGYAVESLPKSAIVDFALTLKGSTKFSDSRRVFERQWGSTAIVLDEGMSIAADVKLADPLDCGQDEGDNDDGTATPDKKAQFKQMLEDCPQCGVMVETDEAVIFEMKNIPEFTNTKLGKEVAAKGGKAQAGKASATQAAPMNGPAARGKAVGGQ